VFICVLAYVIQRVVEKLFLHAQKIIKKILPSTVIIFTYNENGENIRQGSGFFVSSNGDIITNIHVLLDPERAKVKATNGKVYPITQIVAENKQADIVRASVNVPKPIPGLSLSNSIPDLGEKIAVIGNPLRLEQIVSNGIVSVVMEIPAFRTYSQT